MPKLGEHPSVETSNRHSESMRLVWANKKEKKMENQSVFICTFPQMTALLVKQYEEVRTWNAERSTPEKWHDMLQRHNDERLKLTKAFLASSDEHAGYNARNVKMARKTWHLLKMAEECNELSDAIMKHFTKGGLEVDIVTEAAHVEVALDHLYTIYDRTQAIEAKDVKYTQIAKKLDEQEKEVADKQQVVRDTLEAYHESLVTILDSIAKYVPPSPAERIEKDNLVRELKAKKALALECLKDLG